jgi:hypothetical protein
MRQIRQDSGGGDLQLSPWSVWTDYWTTYVQQGFRFQMNVHGRSVHRIESMAFLGGKEATQISNSVDHVQMGSQASIQMIIYRRSMHIGFRCLILQEPLVSLLLGA